ncbi:MAG: RIP metalloprotease RseP [Proteobacteria bacterium]|nr:RIP metalloprotease RseP [Pseudomonadota bacterium]
MNTVLISIASFIVAISVIVTIHELGHYLAARLLGVRVLRFSVGFGKPLLRYVSRHSGIEYVLAALPLGGYVKMLDEREAPVEEKELAFAFNRKPVASRFAIVAAGPLFNFLLAIIAYLMMYVVGVQGFKPEIGATIAGSPAYVAGLRAGDEIMRVNNVETQTWEDAGIAFIDQALSHGVVAVTKRDAQGYETELMLDLSDTRALLDEGMALDKIGIQPWRASLPAVLGELTEEGAAQRAGLQPKDRIVAVDDQLINDWSDWVRVIRAHPGQKLTVKLQRAGQEQSLVLTPDFAADSKQAQGRIGAYPWLGENDAERRRIQEEITAHQVTVIYSPLEALQKGVSKTLDMSVLTIKLLAKLVIGEASLKNISGPISIAEYAGLSAQLGLATFLGTLAIISISIGILNLLPIPMLDGGHLMYYCVEIVKGSPVSEGIQIYAQQLGVFLLASLMLVAFYNDFQRLLG